AKLPDARKAALPGLPLRSYLTRLIWLCMVPLLVIACVLAATHVFSLLEEHEHDANELAKRFAESVNRTVKSRVDGLKVLAASPMIDDGSHLQGFYQTAKGFREGFGSEIVLADRQRRMLVNTRVPYGTPLPPLPKIDGIAAAPIALTTGRPAVSDLFVGPVAGKWLVTVAVPVERSGRIDFVLLTTIDNELFQSRILRENLPDSWRLTLVDSRNRIIARAPAGDDTALTEDSYSRYIARPTLTPWSVVVEIPHSATRRPILWAAAVMLAAILAATLFGLFGGISAGRRISLAVNALLHPDLADSTADRITEIAEVREQLVDSAHQRELAEAQLHANEEKFRNAFAHASIGFAMTTLDGTYVESNRAYSNITGYSPEELRTQKISNLIHPLDLAENLREIERLRTGEKSDYVLENRYIHKCGYTIWVRKSTSIVRDAENRPRWIIKLIEDISERKRVESALSEGKATLAAALASMNNSVFICDAQGRYLHVNDAFASFNRFGSKQEAARHLEEFADAFVLSTIDGQPVPFENWPVPRALRGESMIGAEYKVQRKDTGESWYGSYNCSPIRDENGTIVGAVVTGSDITEQKR
ncbi:MAG: PAS domain S-box protein, partial [Betaproteobacteria bacterium]|nr:PAS domain S-box protein [Betaproteobacteria bacterium]